MCINKSITTSTTAASGRQQLAGIPVRWITFFPKRCQLGEISRGLWQIWSVMSWYLNHEPLWIHVLFNAKVLSGLGFRGHFDDRKSIEHKLWLEIKIAESVGWTTFHTGRQCLRWREGFGAALVQKWLGCSSVFRYKVAMYQQSIVYRYLQSTRKTSQEFDVKNQRRVQGFFAISFRKWQTMQAIFRFSPKPRKIAEVFPELAVVPCQYTGAYGTLVMSCFLCGELCLTA